MSELNVLSIDLAHKSYADIGVCSLRVVESRIGVAPIRLSEFGLTGRPTCVLLAGAIADLAAKLDARLVFIDGPQAWKAPDNGLLHSRVCERQLATQGKTGLPGFTKPSNYAPFIAFAIELFDRLAALGWPRLPDASALASSGRFSIESFPTSAWRSLGLKPLPGKANTPVGMVQAEARGAGSRRSRSTSNAPEVSRMTSCRRSSRGSRASQSRGTPPARSPSRELRRSSSTARGAKASSSIRLDVPSPSGRRFADRSMEDEGTPCASRPASRSPRRCASRSTPRACAGIPRSRRGNPAHLTIVYHDEAPDPDLLRARLAAACRVADSVPARARRRRTLRGAGRRAFLAVSDPGGGVARLRRAVLDAAVHRASALRPARDAAASGARASSRRRVARAVGARRRGRVRRRSRRRDHGPRRAIRRRSHRWHSDRAPI